MKFTYIKLLKNQEKANDKITSKKSYSKGKHALDKNEKIDKQKVLDVYSKEKFLNKSYKEANEEYKVNEKGKNIKRILSKNQVALYAISLMLITSGYFNYTNKLKMAELGDAQLVSTNLSVDENRMTDEVNETIMKSELKDDIKNDLENEQEIQKSQANIENELSEENRINQKVEENKRSKEDETNQKIGENKQSNENDDSNIKNEQANNENVIQSSTSITNGEYFVQTKLERDKMYSQMIETYEKILENNNISTEQKNTASEEVKNINNKRNGIATSETLIKAKGIDDIIIIANGEIIDAIVKSNDNLSTEQVAQISNIISRELGASIENIHITTHK